MIKYRLAPIILALFVSLSGCATQPKPTIEKPSTQTEAPVYPKNEVVKTSYVDSNSDAAIAKNTATTQTVPYHVQTGRYTVVKAAPTIAQSNLLEVMITVTIPQEIQTIDATIRYLLKRSGYFMPKSRRLDHKTNQLLVKRLPEIHRRIGPMRLLDALTMLATPAFEVIADPVRREIKYRLKKPYQITQGVQS